MNKQLIALLLLLSFSQFTITTTEFDLVPTRGKIYHPGTDQQFHDTLNNFELVVVDFYADWCGPCVQMHKVIEDLATDKECEDILFIKVNTSVHYGLSHQFGITGLPTIILFVDGKPIKRLHGYHNKKDLKAAIKSTFRVPKT